MEITREEFKLKLNELSKNNWKVRRMLEDCDSYGNLPEHIRKLIDKELKINRYFITDSGEHVNLCEDGIYRTPNNPLEWTLDAIKREEFEEIIFEITE